MKNKKRNFIVYIIILLGDFEKLILNPNLQLKDLLDDDFIILFVDPQHFRVWLWHGNKTTTRTRFQAARMAPAIIDILGIDFKITALDQVSETQDFLAMIGSTGEIEEIDFDKLLKALSQAKIMEFREDLKNKIVIARNKIYKWEIDKNGL